MYTINGMTFRAPPCIYGILTKALQPSSVLCTGLFKKNRT